MSAQLPKSNTPELSETSDQSGLYLLLAELLHLEIDPRLRELLLQPEILEAFQQLDDRCESYLTSDWSEKDYETAAVEFCTQFILNDSDSVPRAAAWIDESHSKVLEDVVFAFIKEWKIEVPPSYQKLAHDHVSLLLYLSSTIRSQDINLAKEFDELTLAPWIAAFGKSLTSSPVPVYRAIGQILIDEI